MLRLFKRNSYPELEAELHLLCREWFEGQIGHLPPDELPPQEEIEADVLEMRNDVYRKLSPMLKSSSALRGRKPNDAENDTTLANLVSAYSGRESTTPILTKLALSKRGDERYQTGWPLCTIRLIAEAWLEESKTPS